MGRNKKPRKGLFCWISNSMILETIANSIIADLAKKLFYAVIKIGKHVWKVKLKVNRIRNFNNWKTAIEEVKQNYKK